VNDEERQQRFAAALESAWEAWWTEVHYRWRRYRQMIRAYEAVGTVKRLVVKPGVSPGFQRLADAGRLDLTMEALVLHPDFAPLFTNDERDAARKRLQDHRYRA
jgi:hypothetical protein